jgi:protein Mpv17
MSALNFAGRSTLRRLHQTVQRNILRDHHARFQSSNSSTSKGSRNASSLANDAKSKGWTIPGPGWAFVEPILGPFRAYGRMQQRSPLLTQFESSLTIYFLGDLSAQTVASGGFKDNNYEPARGLRALLIGGLSSIPSYKWFMFLGTHFNYSSHIVSLAVKIVINQTFFTPIFNTYFFGMQSLLSGSTLAEAKQRVIDTVPVSWKNSWKVWPVVTAFSFTYVLPQYRNVFAGVIAVGWQTYLSWLNKNAEAKEAGIQEAKAGKNATAKA